MEKDQTNNEEREERPKLNRLRERGIIESQLKLVERRREIFQKASHQATGEFFISQRPTVNANRGGGVSWSFLEDGTDLGPQVHKLGTLGIVV
jgi:hypothetical protein